MMGDRFITKHDAKILQGIAVMLMVWHHLFAFPDRIIVPYTECIVIFGVHVESILSYAGRFCISMFSFISGYGMLKKYLNERNKSIKAIYSKIVESLIKFYTNYWGICIIFVSYGFITGKYSVHLQELIKTILGFSCTYNAEWWYISQYIGYLLVFPILLQLVDITEKRPMYWIIFIAGFYMINKYILHIFIFEFLLCFILGIIVVQYRIFDKIYSNKVSKYLIIIIGILMSFVRSLVYVQSDKDYLFVLPIIFSILIFVKSKYCSNLFRQSLQFIGRHSLNIWLIHTFWAYYYFQKITFSLYYSIPIYIVCIGASILSGVIINRLTIKCMNLDNLGRQDEKTN